MSAGLELCQKRKELVEACMKEHGIEKGEAILIVAKDIGIKDTTLRDDIRRVEKVAVEEEITTDEELSEYCVKLAKQKQRYQDTNRIERKSFRESARVENAIEALNVEMISLLKKNRFNTWEGESMTSSGTNCGVIQFSDAHLNELVDLPNNRYDIEIASARIRKHVTKSIEYFEDNNVGTILVAFTGDMINSDRRLDEKLSMASNRMRATFLAIEIFKQALEELSSCFKVYVASVTGNESRVNDDYAWSDAVMSDNYDVAIHNVLDMLFEGNDNVTFIGDCEVEKVVEIGGQNILLVHGNQIQKDISKSLAKTKTRYMHQGVCIDYVLFGHIHECLIADLYARSASTVGANAYSENGLQLTSRASQNAYVINACGSIEGKRMDLQNIDDIDGYCVKKKLMAYNAKSASKLNQTTTIFQVVV